MWPRIWGGTNNNCLTAAETYPQSSLLPSTEFYHISFWRLYLFPYTYLRTDCCHGGVHTVQQKHAPSYIHRMYNVLVSIYIYIYIYFPFRGRNLAKTKKNYPGFQILLFRTEIRVNFLFSVDGDTKNNIWNPGYLWLRLFNTNINFNNKTDTNYYNWLRITFQYKILIFEIQGHCEYFRRTPTSTPTTTDTNYYNWLYVPSRPQRHLQSNVYTRTAIQQLPGYIYIYSYILLKLENLSWWSPCSK